MPEWKWNQLVTDYYPGEPWIRTLVLVSCFSTRALCRDMGPSAKFDDVKHLCDRSPKNCKLYLVYFNGRAGISILLMWFSVDLFVIICLHFTAWQVAWFLAYLSWHGSEWGDQPNIWSHI